MSNIGYNPLIFVFLNKSQWTTTLGRFKQIILSKVMRHGLDRKFNYNNYSVLCFFPIIYILKYIEVYLVKKLYKVNNNSV